MLLSVPLLAGSKRRSSLEPVLTPDLKALEELPIEVHGETLRFQAGGVLIQVRHLDEGRRKLFFLRRTRSGKDPFPPRSVYPDGFTTFEVSFLNGSNKVFQFSPGMASISINKRNKEFFAHGLGAHYSYLSQVFQNDDALIGDIMNALYTQTVLLNPGERTTQLLVFDGLPLSSRSVVLKLDFLHLGHENQDLALPYRASRPKKED